MIVISSSLVLSPIDQTVIDGRNPRIGYHNLVTPENITADYSAPEEPVVNLANPATYLFWRSPYNYQQAITVQLDTARRVDYFGIAKHNLGSTGCSVQYQYSTDGVTWLAGSSAIVPTSDAVVLYQFDAIFAAYHRLWLIPFQVAPSMAVLYFGEMLALQRRIYVGHTPFPYGRNSTVSTGRSENGQFLGRVLRREFFESAVEMGNLTPAWYRAGMEPFARVARTQPFFWAWRPSQYPDESGYAWLSEDVRVSNQRPNGMMQMSFAMQGVR